MHETLLTEEEMFKADDLGDYYRIKSDSRGLNYDKYFSVGDVDNNMFNNMHSNKAENIDKYNSNSAKILPVEEVEKILKQIPEVKSLM